MSTCLKGCTLTRSDQHDFMSKRLIIDAYTHFCCSGFVDFLEKESDHEMVFKRLFSLIPELIDVDKRIKFMDEFGVDVSCLVPLPWLECEPKLHADKDKALKACQVANDEMSKLVSLHPDRFIGVALVPTASSDAMISELHRAVKSKNLTGVALFCGPTVKPLDHESYEPLYRECEALEVPIWIHPCRPQSYGDYDEYERQGKGSMYQIWNSFGWIYDTSVAMVHIALGGVFRRYPNLKIVSHHHGGMVPFFTERFVTQRQNFNEGSETDDLLADLKLFYCDTATFGINSMNVEQAMGFFAPNRVLFGTDTPMDMGNRGRFLKCGVETVEGLRCLPTDGEQRKQQLDNIYHGNFLAMLGTQAPCHLIKRVQKYSNL